DDGRAKQDEPDGPEAQDPFGLQEAQLVECQRYPDDRDADAEREIRRVHACVSCHVNPRMWHAPHSARVPTRMSPARSRPSRAARHLARTLARATSVAA